MESTQVLTVVTRSEQPELWQQIKALVGRVSAAESLAVPGFKWLAENKAADFYFNDITAASGQLLTGRLEQQHWPVDCLLQRTAHRRKKLLVADMEATIIRQEMVDEMARVIGCEDTVVAITRQAMAGQLDFSRSLALRIAAFKGQPVSLMQELCHSITPNPGAVTLIKTLRKHGVYTALVTGGFQIFADHVMELCGFDHSSANRVETEAQQLTGRLLEPVIDSQGKKAALFRLIREQQLQQAQVCAVGDGANDIDMLIHAGLAVGYQPKEVLEPVVDLCIRHTDLTTLLYVQGYHRDEFADA
ncbi:phosphoserine phosphatase SerB [Aliamphritea hakodatensis]|uniref:phosphoserine phosphatase SerB n=1 Tax=Aliamphritea hakodatensis TaxID=2895352 RepID=UPI0022FD6A86|nr:phosphoserine phosphatase SerB [Aliamphritea hakodatensis]